MRLQGKDIVLTKENKGTISYFMKIAEECIHLGYTIKMNFHLILVTSKNYKNTVDVSWSRGPRYICVDNDNQRSVCHRPYDRCTKLSTIIKSVQRKLEEE